MQWLFNHVGYRPAADKQAILQSHTAMSGLQAALLDCRTQSTVWQGSLQAAEQVPGWQGRFFHRLDFSAWVQPGQYQLWLLDSHPPLVSAPFEIQPDLFAGQMVSDLLHYFKSQRCSGIYDQADRTAPLLDSRQPVDVHGGWYDASGDVSKYLSHLSYANHMNPQQTPLLVWQLADASLRLPATTSWFDERVQDEALHGADFLSRMQLPDGAFLMTVFDRWSKDPSQRELCAYATQKGHKSADYRAGFRQGAGLAIAALARASCLARDGEYSREDYYRRAAAGYQHLRAHNPGYLDDGQENLIDDYCALLAACELAAARPQQGWLEEAGTWVARMATKQDDAGFWWMTEQHERSYFHASDAGLPLLALTRYLELAGEGGAAACARQQLQRGWQQQLKLAARTHNPFAYPRHWVVQPGQPGRSSFFIPHQNESGYWWQGENARLASLAAAARLGLQTPAAQLTDLPLARLAQHCCDWIMGANPFDVCMLQGWGRNNPRYEPGYWNACGGVANGITAGLEDEADIDFRIPAQTEMGHSWRWTEQWLPHGSWLFHALVLDLSNSGKMRGPVADLLA
ncbi:glycoside hydrolase family 9 protein [Leeia aquatica]|uniref:Endoglucanase-like protein n=1 Tax=Leeia aquatica TaxID=2725557 RepID=A0A847RV83_9NEIS|nr:glycoside hydrolase family 9 protein [Leeia aquatica]NLR73741.1 endoglucanase-like protein [Leeia aquatica]